MSKICPETKSKVIYAFCAECEEKQCRRTQNNYLKEEKEHGSKNNAGLQKEGSS